MLNTSVMSQLKNCLQTKKCQQLSFKDCNTRERKRQLDNCEPGVAQKHGQEGWSTEKTGVASGGGLLTTRQDFLQLNLAYRIRVVESLPKAKKKKNKRLKIFISWKYEHISTVDEKHYTLQSQEVPIINSFGK